ncbi:hypothetical protein RAS2_30160 [Phycisphaerae bacterium RAS2]|nr:hypothetical protein RAS2_30160 [Phycisphaerae bacterium RAS2]
MQAFDSDNLEREIAESERWLRQIETPSPSPKAIANLKEVLTAEMGSDRVGGRAAPMRRFSGWHGSLAAAAALLLAVGIGWYSFSGHGRSALATAETGEPIPLSADASEQLSRYSDWERELSALESESLDDVLSGVRDAALEIGA